MEEIKDFISKKQPFVLTYRNNAGCVDEVNVLYAQIKKAGSSLYLSCWTEETILSEISELAHNRFIRCDHILEVSHAKKQWRESGLDTLILEFEISGTWASKYQPRIEDISNTLLQRKPHHYIRYNQTRRIKRTIHSSIRFS